MKEPREETRHQQAKDKQNKHLAQNRTVRQGQIEPGKSKQRKRKGGRREGVKSEGTGKHKNRIIGMAGRLETKKKVGEKHLTHGRMKKN